jgi:hypothetical protein
MAKEHEKLQTELAKSGHVVPESRFVEDENATQQSAEQESGDGGKAAAEIDGSESEHGYHGKLLSREEYEKKLGAGPDENKSALDAAARTASTPTSATSEPTTTTTRGTTAKRGAKR